MLKEPNYLRIRIILVWIGYTRSEEPGPLGLDCEASSTNPGRLLFIWLDLAWQL